MNNAEALRSLCNAIANTFYPDDATLAFVLFNQGIDAEADAAPKDAQIFRAAVSLVNGYVESSRTENGVSTSVKEDAVKESLLYWCNYYGLDASEELGDYLRIIDDASNMW
ncbi:MAG: hypothetical protein NC548_48590 [Lachnospiraceae bacterium]|nr:hypothetical protein [Bacteroides sp.]MCM1222354.1 hypothetical protein [Lachnospiraceae bacterium]